MKRKRQRKNSIQYLLLILTSLLFIPLLFALIANFPVLFFNYHNLTETMLFSIAGFIFFTIFYYTIGQPVRSYIIAHELSHIVFAFLTGTRVNEVSFKKNNSFVKTRGTNVFISLGPYILPIYSIISILIYKTLSIIIGYSRPIAIIFYFITGAGLSFHILLTIHYLKYDQPDMKRYGYFFSLTFVMVWMIINSAFLLSLMFPRIELIKYLLNVWIEVKGVYLLLFSFITHIEIK